MTDEIASPLTTSNTTDWRLTRVEKEVGELRSKLESGQGAMLQAVASLGSQLTQFQLTLKEDLSRNYVSQRDFEHAVALIRERQQEAITRLDKFDAIYIKALDEARLIADKRRAEDSERALRINLALFASALSFIANLALHFIKF
jgi:hypothetical protein